MASGLFVHIVANEWIAWGGWCHYLRRTIHTQEDLQELIVAIYRVRLTKDFFKNRIPFGLCHTLKKTNKHMHLLEGFLL